MSDPEAAPHDEEAAAVDAERDRAKAAFEERADEVWASLANDSQAGDPVAEFSAEDMLGAWDEGRAVGHAEIVAWLRSGIVSETCDDDEERERIAGLVENFESPLAWDDDGQDRDDCVRWLRAGAR